MAVNNLGGHNYFHDWEVACSSPSFPMLRQIFFIFFKLSDYFYDDAASLCYKAPTSHSVCVGCPCVIIHDVFVNYGRTFSEQSPT